MISSGMQKMLLSVAVIIVVAFVGYRVFLTESEITVDTTLEGIPATGQDILDLVAELDSIQIDQTIFTSSLFASLVDYKIPLQEETQGRTNPFAPFVGGVPTPGLDQMPR